MKYGTKYLMKHIIRKNAAIKQFTTNIDIFMQKIMYRYNLPCSLFEEYKFYILRNFKTFTKIAEEIKKLQENLITYVDKANTS